MLTVAFVYVEGFPLRLARDPAGHWFWCFDDVDVPVRAGLA